MSRVLVIGLDGATLDLVEPWAQAGQLPVLADMMRCGSYGRLRSVLPVLSSAAWASMMTGMNPGKHGLFDFVRREPGSYRLRVLRRDHMRGASLWRILSDYGRKVGVVNVPMTYPPEQVNGFIVSGLGTPDYKPFTYPQELGAKLLARGYRVNKLLAYRPGNEAAFLREVYEMTDRLTDSALWLMHERDWDFFMVVFRDTDELAHFFWKHMDPTHPAHNPAADRPYQDAILDYYRKVDTIIGEFVQAAGPDTTTIILSDHGAGPLYRDVFLNEWLRQTGFLATKSSVPQIGMARGMFARVGLTRTNISATLRRLRLGKVEQWLKDRLGDRIEWLPRTRRVEFAEAIDWSRTRAYSFGYHGQIYVNLRGREPEGIVAPGAEYDRLCKEIEATLRDLTDPRDGKPVVDQVIRREQVFSGPCVEYAPDLIIIMRNLSYITRQGHEFGEQSGQLFADPLIHQSGSHRMDGLLILSGADVINGDACKENSAQLPDIAPTILHLLGCPAPSEMDGRVLQDWISTRRQVSFSNHNDESAHSAPYEQTLSEDEEQEIVTRLKNLGYLD